ncbi:MAG: tRNA (N(6)-L-threonylcarbamoyladenosine(37)-C(2))-methylthiotransferase MtaB [Magnetococcales bacterium]|nr:tRNA (N(6)-L-threonylcarbamoyladenosine(37)-C(2))-methylthiotransferase MtaB [Magnetococcales bacterium]MBF0437733.1 tRNA (N(6)-L-threonylcarbamoyladenosine(37)-C(2))-methylthiotransferase MtaB [Magnetococcales bacterium]
MLENTLNRLDPDVNGPEEPPRLMTVLTMGCRVNQFESAAMGQGGVGRGYRLVEAGEVADLVVINTCSVTGESDRQARQLIRRAVREYPDARIVVTGCYAQRAPENVAALPGVDLVLGNGEKGRLWEVMEEMALQDSHERIRVGDVSRLTEVPLSDPVDHFGDRSRAFLHAQDGCDRACAYCLIPSVRGPSRSVPLQRVVEQAQHFLEAGYEELVLTGVNIGAYGRDFQVPSSLAGLVQALLDLPGLGRLRLSSLDPLDIDQELVTLFATRERLCGYLHLSIQSGDDGVRKRMGRGRGRREVLERIAWVRKARPEVVFGADFIAGFPSETEEAFAQTVALTSEAELSLLHVFPYSVRPDTLAAAMPSSLWVSGEQIRERALRLRQAGEAQLARVLVKRLGCTETVLVETVEEGWGSGKTDGFLPMRFPEARAEWRGGLLSVRVVGIDEKSNSLLGRVVEAVSHEE